MLYESTETGACILTLGLDNHQPLPMIPLSPILSDRWFFLTGEPHKTGTDESKNTST